VPADNIKAANEGLASTYGKDTWVEVPTTTIPKSGGVYVYGKLAGKFVPGPIWNDIRQVARTDYKPWGDAYRFLLSSFKVSKTALSPTVHMNNIMANFLMADWHDVQAVDMAEAAWVLLNKKSDATAEKLWHRYEDSGASIGMFAQHEIKREQIAPLLDKLRQEIRGLDNTDATMRIGSIISDLLHGNVADAVTAVKHGKVYAVGKKVIDLQIDQYQREDEFFRLATFIRAIGEGKTDQQAGKEARRSFLDYDINAPWIQAMRHTVFPFISFPYRALPMLVDVAKNKPWKLAKLMLLASVLNAFGYLMTGGDEDDERAFLADQKAGKLWGIVPKLIRMPWNDANDKPVFLDVRRWVPLGDFFDVGQTNSALPLLPVMVPGGPMAVLAELYANRSAFTGKDVTKDTDSMLEAAGAVSDHLYKAMMPNAPWVPGSYSASNIYGTLGDNPKTDPFGREYSTGQALFSSFGIKIASYPIDNLKRNALFRHSASQAEIRHVIQEAVTQESRNAITRDQLDAVIEKQRKKLADLNQEFMRKAGRQAD
jgi:hypothetical protein